MSWERTTDVLLDATKPGAEPSALQQNGTAFAVRSSPYRWIEGDCFPLRIFLVDPSTNTYDNPADVVVLMSCKQPSAMDDGDTLFSAQDFSVVEPSEGVYALECDLNLNTDEIETALDAASQPSSSAKKIAALVDVEIQNALNTKRSTYRFEVEIHRQVYKDGDLEPSPGAPTYPAPDALVANNSGSVDIDDGASSVVVDLTAHGLAAAPAVVLPSICKPAADAPQVICTGYSDVTANGFTAHLAGSTPTAGYKLNYLVIP